MQQPPQAPYDFMPPSGSPQEMKVKSWRVALLIGVCAVMLPLFIGATVLALRAPSLSVVPVAAAFTPTSIAATATPLPIVGGVPTPPGPYPIFDSTLGGTLDDFTVTYEGPAEPSVWKAELKGHAVEIHIDTAPMK